MNPWQDVPTHKLVGLIDLVNLIGVAVVILLIGAGLTALVAILRAAFPSAAASLDEASSRRGRLRRLAIGVLNGPALLVLAMAFGSRPATKGVGIGILLLLIALVLLGLCAEIPRIGRSLLRPGGTAASPLASTLAGGAALTACVWLPFVGWACVVAVALIGVGGAVSWIFSRRPVA
jgi:hypothetical protein